MAPISISVKDVITFHKIDRAVYAKFVAHGMEHGRARNAVALFMWLEQRHCIDIICQIVQIINPTMVLILIAEADAVLHCLQQDDGQSCYTEIPTITSLSKNRVSILFFNINKDEIVRGVVSILDGVGRFVFDDYMYELLQAYESEEAAARAGLSTVKPAVPPALAISYAPAVVVPSTENERSMVIAFSTELPIGRDVIWKFCTEKWGANYIERVMMERAPPGETSMYGIIVFKSDSYINLVLNGGRVVKYNINGRQLLARKYVPMEAINQHQSNNTNLSTYFSI
ncbi:hypothetical protein LUZ63_009611 [Rhynchospora breviuscula]|uniref:Uncharacterized protein n=1 Tax=Rhynchospora breviuscula TaxID=2022672 RepID=A0A9Q0CFH2_9POAL|nr:hypothetical protein LUZ63_009611 [Rhynchospora breviuscula]